MKFAGFYRAHKKSIILLVSFIVLVIAAVATMIAVSTRPVETRQGGSHLITVYDRGVRTLFLSDAKTVGEALAAKGFEIDVHDAVEPQLTEELIAQDYWVNIYRARPVIVIDGSTRVKTTTPYQTAEQIANDVDINLHPEDDVELQRSTDYVGEGAGLELVITRSVPLQLDLYGRKTKIRTTAKTVGEMLDKKGIVLGEHGRTSRPLDAPITAGMSVRVWREGKQTISYDEPLPFKTQTIYDADRFVGYKAVTTEGKNGVQTVSFEVEVKDGVEISRVEIARIVTTPAVKQVEVIGIKSRPGALTQLKGAQLFTDSKGVVHRETYYDLDMRRVMQSCGQGGYYTVRIDGVKVDRDGYAIIAANYARYPKCSIVETSVGPGKVYDTGGFALHHPDGFDIATDWSNPNGI